MSTWQALRQVDAAEQARATHDRQARAQEQARAAIGEFFSGPLDTAPLPH